MTSRCLSSFRLCETPPMRGLVLAAVLATLSTAHADDSAPPVPARDRVSAGRRALAISAAVFPGFVLRGTGSYLVGEKRAAKRLAFGAIGGLVAAGAAGGVIFGSGANPYSTAAVPLLVPGVGAFLTSWVEDIWIAAGGTRALRWAPEPAPRWSVEAGEVWQHGAYRERLYQHVGVAANLGRLGARASGLLDANGEAWLAFGDVRARVLGDGADALVVRAGGRYQVDDDDNVTQLVGELELIGRLDLHRFDEAFRASFVQASSGIGVDRARYAGVATDVDSLLLATFAWGVYVPGGELTLYYDHRRDGLAGGIDAWRASGFIGSFGASADVRIDGPWALRGEFQVGNSYLTTLALSYRGGSR